MTISSNQTSTRGESDIGTPVGSGLASDLRQQADDLTGQAKAKAKEAAHSGQTMAADQLEHLAQGVRRSVESFDDDQAWIRQGLSTAANSLERFSSTLRERDLGDLMHEAEDAARRHPVVFATACAIAGFALVRFLKSSRREGMGMGGDFRARDSGMRAYGRRSSYDATVGGVAHASPEQGNDRAANI